MGLQTPLSGAALAGHTEVVGTLVEARANPNIATVRGRPISLAVAGGHLEIASLLIDAGADMSARPKNMAGIAFSPLTMAVRGGHTEIVRLLVDSGAYPCRQGNSLTFFDLPYPSMLIEWASSNDEVVALLARAGEGCDI